MQTALQINLKRSKNGCLRCELFNVTNHHRTALRIVFGTKLYGANPPRKPKSRSRLTAGHVAIYSSCCFQPYDLKAIPKSGGSLHWRASSPVRKYLQRQQQQRWQLMRRKSWSGIKLGLPNWTELNWAAESSAEDVDSEMIMTLNYTRVPPPSTVTV